MDKKEIITIILKVLLYAITLIASAFGVYSLSSCGVSHDFTHSGTGYFQYYDTLKVDGSNYFEIIKSK